VASPVPEPVDKPLLAVLRGERRDPPPIWLMRQAGRYLPEYRELRTKKGGFLDMAYDPEAAAEITLQPLRRFPFDGAILFSDILIVPFAIGQNLTFIAGEGPRLTPTLLDSALDLLEPTLERLDPIYETVAKVKAALAPDKTLIGFAGSPWTVATYMVAGQGSREQSEARRMAYADPAAFDAIIERMLTVGRKSNVAIGIHAMTPEQLGKRQAQGFRMISYSTDYMLMAEAARAGLSAFKRSTPGADGYK